MHFKKTLDTQALSHKKDLVNSTYNVNDLTLDFNNLLPTSLIDDLDPPTQEEEDEDQTSFNDTRKYSPDNLSFQFQRAVRSH